jgi:hypothetical protein
MVFANILSSAPPKWLGDRRGASAHEFFGLNESSLSLAMRTAGIRTTNDQVAEQVAVTTVWRKKEGARLGRPHYVPMAPATIGRLLGVTAGVRLDAKAWSIIPYGATKEQMMEEYRERQREREDARRRAKNITPLEQCSRRKPWAKLGISRRTWYRQGKPGIPPDEPEAGKASIPADRSLHWKGKFQMAKAKHRLSDEMKALRAHAACARGALYRAKEELRIALILDDESDTAIVNLCQEVVDAAKASGEAEHALSRHPGPRMVLDILPH